MSFEPSNLDVQSSEVPCKIQSFHGVISNVFVLSLEGTNTNLKRLMIDLIKSILRIFDGIILLTLTFSGAPKQSNV